MIDWPLGSTFHEDTSAVLDVDPGLRQPIQNDAAARTFEADPTMPHPDVVREGLIVGRVEATFRVQAMVMPGRVVVALSSERRREPKPVLLGHVVSQGGGVPRKSSVRPETHHLPDVLPGAV